MERVNLRLDVTKEERDLVRRAAAAAGYRSMSEFCRATVLERARRIVRHQVRAAPKDEIGGPDD